MSKIAIVLLVLCTLGLSAARPAFAGAGVGKPATRIGPIEKRMKKTGPPVCFPRHRTVKRGVFAMR
jgi:hypothetical protein